MIKPIPGWQHMSRAQFDLHVLIALLVALAVAAGTAVPRLVSQAADAEITGAVAEAGRRADVAVTFPWNDDPNSSPQLAPDSAGAIESMRVDVAADVPEALADVLGPPVTVMTSPPLKAGAVDARPILVRLAYVSGDGAADVTWAQGDAPGPGPSAAALAEGAAPIVEVGVSAAVADAWGVKPGDERLLPGATVVRVSGIFVPVEPQAGGWMQVPQLLAPREIGGSEPRIDAAVLLGDDSLPYALYALGDSVFTHVFVLSPVPDRVSVDSATTVATEARGLSSGRHTFSFYGRAATVSTSLDRVIDEAIGRTDAARAQAMVMLAGVLAASMLAISLAGEALARRRASLAQLMRKRGASRTRIAVSFGAEAAMVSVGAGALGWALVLFVHGGTSWWVALPVIAAIVAPAAALTRTAHAATSREAPALGTRRRRVAAGGLVLLNLLLWAVALGTSRPPAAAVVLAPVAASVLIAAGAVRVVPWLAGTWRRVMRRRRGAAGLIASAHVLAPLAAVAAVITGSALVAVVVVADASARAAGERASWDVVGADAVAQSTYGAPLPDGSEQIAAGASEYALAAVEERVQIFDEGFDDSVTVVAVDPVAIAGVLERARHHEVREFEVLLGDVGAPEAIPVLASGVPDREGLTLRWEGRRVAVDVVGGVPALPEGVTAGGPVVVVSRVALESASGLEISPTHVWLNGDGSTEAAAALKASGANVTVRSAWVEALTESPVAQRGEELTSMTVAATALVTIASVVMWCLAGSAARSRTFARMAVLGFASRYRRRTGLASAVVPVAVAALIGVTSGVVMSSALVAPLGLDALAGGAHIDLVVPWWLWAFPLVCACVAAVTSLRGASVGPFRLGSVLREG